MSTTRVEGYRRIYGMAHEWLEGTIAGISTEQACYCPDGKAMPAGAHYAHHVQGEDAIFNGMLQGKTPLMAGEFAGKIGTPEPAPQGDWSAWARSTTINMEEAHAYAQAVYAATDAYLAGLTDADLDSDLDMSAFEMGTQPLSMMLDILLLDTAMHTGEISSVKGLQGLKGYPF